MIHHARILVAFRVSAAACSAVWLLLAARWLPQKDFGDLALLLALAVVAAAGSDLGYSVSLPASVRRTPEAAGTTLRLALRHRVLAGSLAAGAAAAFYWVASDSPDVLAAGAIGVSVVATSVHTACSAAMRGENRVVPEALGEFVSRVGVLAIGAAGLAGGLGLSYAAGLYAVADVVVATVLFRTASAAYGHRRGPVARSSGRAALAVGLPLGTAYWRIDVWFVGVLGSAREVALYGAAYRLLDGLLLPASASSSFIPGEVASTDPREGWARMKRLLLFGLALTTVPAVVVIASAGAMLKVLFGTEYVPAEHALIVLMIAAVPSVLVIGATQALGVLRPAALPALMGGALFCNIGLNLWLIPDYGAAGAAWATLVCQVLLAAALVLQLRGRGPAREIHVPVIRET